MRIGRCVECRCWLAVATADPGAISSSTLPKRAEEITEIRRRLADILQGSYGGDGPYWEAPAFDPERDGEFLPHFYRYLDAVEFVWGHPDRAGLFAAANFGKFITLDSAAAWLHENGCRASAGWGGPYDDDDDDLYEAHVAEREALRLAYQKGTI